MTAEAVNDTPQRVSFELNGEACTIEVQEGETLLEALRDQLGLRSPKDGCSPQGQCGCCLVKVNGQGVTSCAMLATKVEGKKVVTNEGLGSDERELISRCFVATGGVQCGFCIPGFVSRTSALLDRNPDPSRDQIRKALGVHLCRCTGYVKILDAIELSAKVKRGDCPLPELQRDGGVGKRLPRYLGERYALGDEPYVEDMVAPGMLHGAVRLSDHPRARVLRIDTSKAEALEGVVRIATAKDVRGTRRYGLIEQDWASFVAEGETTCMVGDVIAIVAAADRRTARRAAELIEIDYQVLEPITDPKAAMKPDSPQVHPERGNLLSTTAYTRGDVDEAFANSAHVVKQTFKTQTIEHLYMEPESCMAVPGDDEHLHIYSQGQGVYDDRRQLCRALDLPESRVTVSLVSNGGAFGGKEDLSIQVQTALLAQLCNRPVKTTLSRDESIRMHPKRHPIEMDYEMACDADGKLTALRTYMVADTGAYASVGAKVVERAAGHACGPYFVPAVSVEGHCVYTNNPPNGAMRGFGVNQASFAVEQLLDMLGEKVGLDGYQMREKNLLEEGQRFGPGQKLENCAGLQRTLAAVKEHYYSCKVAGIACGIKNVGIGNGMIDVGRARIEVIGPKRLRIGHGMTEMGQGLHTVAIQMMSEATGIKLSSLEHPGSEAGANGIQVQVCTDHELDCGMTTASRATVLVGNAVIDAGKKLKADLDAAGGDLAKLEGKSYRGEFLCDWTVKPGTPSDNPVTHLSFGFATQVVLLDEESGKLTKVIAAHDVGKAINPTLCEGQIEGSVHMGLGYALSEELQLEGGWPVNATMRKIGVLRAHETPDIEVILVEEPEPMGPYGARGVGEIGLVPTAGAVAAALHRFDGKRRTVLPMRDNYEKTKRR
jgi:xanthine dehydrogenase molybdenum-binding subunit